MAFPKESVTIQTPSLHRIAYRAFAECKNLKEIAFPDYVGQIESRAFEASGLTRVDFPSYCFDVSDRCFRDCKDLKEIVFPDGVAGHKLLKALFHGGVNQRIQSRESLRAVRRGKKPFRQCRAVDAGIRGHDVVAPVFPHSGQQVRRGMFIKVVANRIGVVKMGESGFQQEMACRRFSACDPASQGKRFQLFRLRAVSLWLTFFRESALSQNAADALRIPGPPEKWYKPMMLARTEEGIGYGRGKNKPCSGTATRRIMFNLARKAHFFKREPGKNAKNRLKRRFFPSWDATAKACLFFSDVFRKTHRKNAVFRLILVLFAIILLE